MTVKTLIRDYLDALERRFGAKARKETQVEYRGGSQVVLKRPGRHPQAVDVGSLRLMTERLREA